MLVFASFKLQRTVFHGLGGVGKNISPHFSTDSFAQKLGTRSEKIPFHFTTDIFSEKNRGLLEKRKNKNTPGFGKSGSIMICNYEVSKNSKHSRCPYTAAK
ncbi:hypothetical protein [Flavonifractor sp. An9]|uniref:hypothetical protein n=1 Tax=Flavonifractor sp. An9 TaxID=1965664 RepID=UPI00117B40D3|nr:hypothetical protein [Flavonifractor sp. An9]